MRQAPFSIVKACFLIAPSYEEAGKRVPTTDYWISDLARLCHPII